MVLHQRPVSQEGLAMRRPPPRHLAQHAVSRASLPGALWVLPHVPQLSWPRGGSGSLLHPRTCKANAEAVDTPLTTLPSPSMLLESS